jgi:hypothetical protein
MITPLDAPARLRRWRSLSSWPMAAWLALAPTTAAAQFQNSTKRPATTAPTGQLDAVSPETCERTPLRVFVTTSQGTECISYYVSGGMPATVPQAVIHFHGDFPRELMMAPDRSAAMGRSFQVRADRAARKFGMPYIYVVRPGLLNSSGDHLKRRQAKEFLTLNAAVDRIKQRHSIDRIAIAGQSGGGSVVAALLSLGRTDVACAAPGSGAFDVVGLYQTRSTLSGRPPTDRQLQIYRARFYSPIEHIAEIPKDATRRLFVVGDPRDKNTFFAQQRDYAYRVKAAGHHAVLLYAPGAGIKKHSVGGIADEVAGLCLQGKTDEQIEAAVSALWKREYTKPLPRAPARPVMPEGPPAAPAPAR